MWNAQRIQREALVENLMHSAAGAAAERDGQRRADSNASSIDIRTLHPGGGSGVMEGSVNTLRRSASWSGAAGGNVVADGTASWTYRHQSPP